jgi:putative transposase
MRFTSSILTSLLKSIDRRHFGKLVEKYDADAYGKHFNSWQHLVTLVYAQLSGAQSLRAVETGFNAQSHHHYHLGCTHVARSTLADANQRRPAGMFMELLEHLMAGLGRTQRKEIKSALHLIDSTPVPLNRMFDCAASNGRIVGLKLHVLHDPHSSLPRTIAITPANVNDIGFGRGLSLESGVTYVFDKAYCHFGWWMEMEAAGSFFVTRPKKNMRWNTLVTRELKDREGDGFTVCADREVQLASRGNSLKTLQIPLRCITIRRDTGEPFDILTNDLSRPAVDLAACYKARWQIELFFKWIKQNLNIARFMATSKNAIHLQIIAALIAYILIQKARMATQSKLSARRFCELVGSFIHTRRPLASIDKPPPIHPSKPQKNTKQMEFTYEKV